MFGEVRNWPLARLHQVAARSTSALGSYAAAHRLDILLCVGNLLGPMLAFEPDDHSDFFFFFLLYVLALI